MYTKGEWKVDKREDEKIGYLGLFNLPKETYPFVINMPTQFSIIGRCGAIVTSGPISKEEAEANANLIVAAPLMYEALEYAVADIEKTGYTSVSSATRMLRALAKVDNPSAL